MATKKYRIAFANMLIPISLEKISKEIEMNFKQLHAIDTCGNRLGRKTWCNTCNVEVPKEEVGKGWVFTAKQEKPLQFTKAEIAALHPKDVPAGIIQVRNFIDPLPFKWFNGNHYAVTPEKKDAIIVQYLALFLRGLEKSGKVALVKFWDGNSEYNAVINSEGILSHIFYADEVGDETLNLNLLHSANLDAKLVTLVNTLMKKQTTEFVPATDLVNKYREAVQAKALEKQENGEMTITPDAVAPATNLLGDLAAGLMAAIGDFKDEDAEIADSAKVA